MIEDRAGVCVWLSVRKAAVVLAATIATFLVCAPMSAQVNFGRISGQVVDQTGGAVAGAKVTVTEVSTGVARVLTTDAAGEYAAPNLNPSTYTVRAEFMGFQAFERQNVDVGVGGDIRVDVTLQPGAQTQTITVTESIPIVNTTNAQTGGVLENQVLNTIPIQGRNYRWQQGLVPGVAIAPGGGTGNIDSNGTVDGHGANNLLDGINDQSYFVAEPTFGGSSEAGDTTLLPLDAIQEVNMVTNPKAEIGWIPGVTANIGLKSGTNDMHGDAFATGQDTALVARNAFATSRQPLAFEQYGGTVGGPIKKDKLFYFAAFEGLNEHLTSVVTEVAPTLANTGSASLSIPAAIAAINAYVPPVGAPAVTLNQLSVNIAGCDFTNANIHSAVAATVATACTSGNQFGAPGLWNNPNLGIIPDDGYSENGLFKMDYHIGDHHTLNGAFARGYYEENAGGNSAASITQNYWEEVLGAIGQMGRVDEVWTPNSSLLNEARWGIDMQDHPVGRAECTPQGDPFSNTLGIGGSTGHYGGPNYVTQYGLLSGAPACGSPDIVLSSPVTAHLGFSNGREDNEIDNQFADILSYTRGAHQFKFGVDVRAVRFIGSKQLDTLSGVIDFGQSGAAAFTSATSLESFLAGVPSEETINSGSNVRHITTQFIGMFAQDDWRIKPRLTLNLGIREEIITPPTSPTDNIGNFDPSTPTGVVALNHILETHYNFEPRLGLVWDVTGKGTNTIRASVGVANGVPTLMNFLSTGSSTSDRGSDPTGELLYPASGVNPLTAPGDGLSGATELLPISGTSGVTKGIVISSPIIWPTNAQNSATTALFPPAVAQCGNGLVGTTTGTPNPVPCVMDGNATNMRYYHYISWNAGFQHALTTSLSLDVTYVGSKSTGILQSSNLNQAPPTNIAADASASYEQSVGQYETQFPWFSSINMENNGATDNYRALQIYLVSRPSHGWAFTVADTISGNYETQGVLNIHLPISGNGPFGYNNYPLNHLAITSSYNLPGKKSPGQILEGWSASGSVNVESSLPYSPSDTTDDISGAGASNKWTMYGPAAPFNQIFGRAGTIPCYGITGSKFASSPCIQVPAGPAATPWSTLPAPCIAAATNEASFTPALAGTTSSGSSLEQLALIGCYMVNGSAIVPPAQGTYGTMLPNSLRGPGVGLVNVAVNKDWKFKERYGAQFRFEVYNLFNVTQYAGQGTNLGSPKSFGLATGTPNVVQGGGASYNGGPRYVQFALKLLF